MMYYKYGVGGNGIKQVRFPEEFVSANPNFSNFFDGFENNLLDYYRIWRKRGGAPLLQKVSSAQHSGTYSLNFNNGSQWIAPSAVRTLYGSPQSAGQVSFWLNPTRVEAGFEFGLLTDSDILNNDHKKYWFRVGPNRTIEFSSEGCAAWNPTSPVELAIGAWSKITLRYDENLSDVSVWLDGAPLGSGGACTSTDRRVSNVGFIFSAEGVTPDSVLLDDIYTQQHAESPIQTSIGDEELIYLNHHPTIRPINENFNQVTRLTSFIETAVKNGGEITYQLSNDAGATWYWWNDTRWQATPNGYEESDTAVTVNQRISTFPVGNRDIVFRAYLNSPNGWPIQLDSVRLNYLTNTPGYRIPVFDLF